MGNSFVTNPLDWTTGNEYAPRELNKGSVLTKFNKVYYSYYGCTDQQWVPVCQETKISLEFSLLYPELSYRRHQSLLYQPSGKYQPQNSDVPEEVAGLHAENAETAELFIPFY